MQFEQQLLNANGKISPQLRTLRASDGYEIAYRLWNPTGGKPRAQILMLHGIQSHGGWYEASSRQLAENGFQVWFPDRRGSGKNSVERGHADSANRLFDDLDEFVELMSRSDGLRTATNRLPMYLLGLSWGGKLALAYASARPHDWSGLILWYPGLLTRIRVRFWQKWIIQLLHAVGIRRLPVSIPLNDPRLFTRSESAQRMIEQDPFSLHETTIAFLHSSLKLDRLALKSPPRLRLPIFCQLAGNDEIVDNRRTKAFLNRFPQGDVTLTEYPAARHTLEFEADREVIVNDLCHWLNLHTPA